MKKHFLALVMLCTRVFSVFTHKKKDLTIYIFTRFIYLYKYSSMYLFLLLIHLYVYLFIINLLIYAFITFFIICLFIHYFFNFKPRIVLISNYNVYICKWTSLLHHIPKYSRPCISMCIKKMRYANSQQGRECLRKKIIIKYLSSVALISRRLCVMYQSRTLSLRVIYNLLLEHITKKGNT